MSRRVVSERLIVTIDFAAWMGGSFFQISPDSQRVTYAARVGAKQFVVVDGNEEKPYDAIMPDTLSFSSDSQRVTYAARVGAKQFVVVDGNEQRHYDGILEGTLSFSPDSQRVAYAFKRARSGSSLWMGKKKSTMMPSLLQEEEEFSLTPKIISVILPEKVPPFTWWRSGSRGLSIAIAQALFMLDAFDLNDGTGELLFKRSALPGCRCYSSHKRHLWMKANGHVR